MRPSSHGLWLSTLNVCVGGLFTFHWFLSGIPLSIFWSLAYLLGKVRVCVCECEIFLDFSLEYNWQPSSHQSLALVKLHSLTNTHILMDSVTFSGLLLGFKVEMQHSCVRYTLKCIISAFSNSSFQTFSWVFLGNRASNICRRKWGGLRMSFLCPSSLGPNLQSLLWLCSHC